MARDQSNGFQSHGWVGSDKFFVNSSKASVSRLIARVAMVAGWCGEEESLVTQFLRLNLVVKYILNNEL
jgi:hypothetical protein